MHLATYRQKHHTAAGLVEDGLVIDLLAAARAWPSISGKLALCQENIFSGLRPGLLDADPALMDSLFTLRRHITAILAVEPGSLVDRKIAFPIEAVSLLPPVLAPRKVICVGMNYPAFPPANFDPPAFPVLFHKTATSLTGQGSPVYMPPEVDYLEYEGELAVVIGRRGRRIPAERAWDYIAGLTAANDVGAPQIQGRTSQWTSGKMLDSFCPLGPVLATIDEFSEPGSLRIRTWLNGELVQDAFTGEMRFDIPSLVSYISSLTTLEAGDVILTGSPRRVGERADPRLPVRPGDRMRVEIEGIGWLENPVLEEV